MNKILKLRGNVKYPFPVWAGLKYCFVKDYDTPGINKRVTFGESSRSLAKIKDNEFMRTYTGYYKWTWIKYHFQEYEVKAKVRKQDLRPVSRLETID